VSHETIYRSLFIQAWGVLKKELLQHIRHKRAMRRSRHKTLKDAGLGQISADSALALGEALKTGPEFWLNLQRDGDLRHAMDAHRKVPLNQGIPGILLKQS
jgi:plasmid maintenance system antidote protein VapI